MKTVTLIKVADVRGYLPIDSTYTWTYGSSDPGQAVVRARKAFENSTRLDPAYKGENILDWKVVP